MTDLDRLLVAAAAFDADEVAALPLADAEAELCEEIMSAHPVALPIDRPGRRWAAAAVAAAALVVVALAGVQVIGSSRGPAWAAEILEVAEAAPRLLVSAPGWEVTRADEFSAEIGETTFTDGNRSVDLHWRPAGTHADYVADRAASADPPSTVTVAGREAVLFRYTGTSDFTALWLDGDHSVELRGEFADEAAYRALAASVERVGVDEWLSAMPASVVRPADRAAVVDEMLADVDVPAGLDVDALRQGAAIRDRYQLGAQVTGTVACAWIEQWLGARAAGDAAAEAEALAAMAGSRDWAILTEMDAQGGYSEMVWLHADAMAGGGGIDLAYYRQALGCGEG